MYTVRDVQIALRKLGFNPGSLDGIFGRNTRAAIEAFQKARNLPVTGQVDDGLTIALFGARATQVASALTLPWFAEAERLKGVREVAGKASNGVILGWAKALGGWVAKFFANDDTPWCGLMVAHCISFALPKEPLPNNPLSALAWNKFGVPLKQPSKGAILVFKRKGGGHVGFYVGETDTAFCVLGGNQDNQVRLSWIAKDRLEAIRWPASTPLPKSGPVKLTASGQLSRDEA